MKTPLLTTIFFLLVSWSRAQVFQNGDFEITTADTCYVIISNSTFDNLMSETHAFGAGNIGLYGTKCEVYAGAAQSGDWFVSLVGISDQYYDAIAMHLTSPALAGHTYELNFYHKKGFYSENGLEVGYTTDDDFFGTSIYSIPVNSDDVDWTLYTVIFSPVVNATSITFSAQQNYENMSFIDNATLQEITGIDDGGFDSQIYLAPNPASDMVEVHTSRNWKNAQCIISDITGRTILSQQNLKGNEFRFAVQNLDPGMYFIQLKEEGVSLKQKFMKL